MEAANVNKSKSITMRSNDRAVACYVSHPEKTAVSPILNISDLLILTINLMRRTWI